MDRYLFTSSPHKFSSQESRCIFLKNDLGVKTQNIGLYIKYQLSWSFDSFNKICLILLLEILEISDIFGHRTIGIDSDQYRQF
jgi:hypothetical protein